MKSVIKKCLLLAFSILVISNIISIDSLAEETGNVFVCNKDCTVYYENRTLAEAANYTRGTTNYWIELWSDATTDGVTFNANGLGFCVGIYTLTGDITIVNGLNMYGSGMIDGTVYVTGGVVTTADFSVADWEISGGTVDFEPTEEDLVEGYEAIDNGDGTWTVQEKTGISGTCGDALNWTLTDEGVLTISGEGKMNSYTQSAQEWMEYRDIITSVVIEDGVTSIGSYAFFYCEALEHISIPDSVQSIGKFAFYYCSKLNDVVIPEGITTLEDYLFYHCQSLENLQLPSTLKLIKIYALGECIFGDLVIPEGVDTLRNYALYLSNWDSLTLPESLTALGEYVFSNCGGMKGIVTTPKNVTLISEGTYCMCGNMTGAVISDGVVNIGSNAFRYCYALKEIWIPESVTSISSQAFYGLTPGEITIYGYEGSTAENYATTYGYQFVAMTEEEAFEIVVQPKNITVTEGENAIFEVEATGQNLTYQWQYSTSGKYWYNSGMEGADTATLTVAALSKRNGQQYRCIIKDAEGNEIISEEVTLTTEAAEIAAIIVKQPENQIAEVGEEVNFVVEAEGEGLTYQWQYSTNGTYWYDSGMEGADTAALTVTALAKRNGQQYRCVVTDNENNELISDTATLTIQETETAVVIIDQPENQTIKEGETAYFVIKADGEELTYQWQYSINGTYWFNSGMVGANTAVLEVGGIAKRDGQQYRCKVTDTKGVYAISNVAVLTVEEAPAPVITVNPEDQTVAVGKIAIFTVVAEGENLTYQWQYSKNGTYWYDSGMEGATTASLVVEGSTKRNGQQYRCVITNSEGYESISDTATIYIE